MALKYEEQELRQAADLLVAPLYSLEAERIPRHTLIEGEMPPDVAYQIVHDELMLDGNARLNVATFVSTWMEPQAEKLMAECLDKNMIDKDEYPQTAELEMRCVAVCFFAGAALLLRADTAPAPEAAYASSAASMS
jgi:glutamate decarboxylase